MGSLTIRNIDDELKQRLRVRGAQRGSSMEDEARSILRAVVSADIPLEAITGGAAPKGSAWDDIKKLRKKYGTFEFDLPERRAMAGDSMIARE